MEINKFNAKHNKHEVINYYNIPFPFSTNEAESRGTAITGMPKSGKSNLAKIIVDYMMGKGYNFKILDPSQTWLGSTVPYYVEVNSFTDLTTVPAPLYKSVVYDTSRMLPDEQKIFVGILIENDFQQICEIPNLKELAQYPNYWIIYVIEEAQMVVPSGSLRATYSQQTFRMVSVGRNFLQRYILLTQRPADISVKALSRAGQMYFGEHWEENDIRKLSRLLNIKYKECKPLLQNLQIGEFIYLNPYDKMTVKIRSPEFTMKVKQINLMETMKPKKQSWWQNFKEGFWRGYNRDRGK